MIMVVMKGVKEINAAIAKHTKATERAIMRGTFKGAMLIQKRARNRIMKGPKSGREYPRGAKSHRASAPGEAPANDTGNLQRSIKVIKGEFAQGVQHMSIEVGTNYAAALEFGARIKTRVRNGKGKMVNAVRYLEPRPFLTPSVQETAAEFSQLIRDELEAL